MFRTIMNLVLLVGLITGGSGWAIKKAHDNMFLIFAERAKRGFRPMSVLSRGLIEAEVKLNATLKK